MTTTYFTPSTNQPIDAVPESVEDLGADSYDDYLDAMESSHIDTSNNYFGSLPESIDAQVMDQFEIWFNDIASHMHNVSNLPTSSDAEIIALLVRDGHVDFTIGANHFTYDGDAGGFILDTCMWATDIELMIAYEHFYMGDNTHA